MQNNKKCKELIQSLEQGHKGLQRASNLYPKIMYKHIAHSNRVEVRENAKKHEMYIKLVRAVLFVV